MRFKWHFLISLFLIAPWPAFGFTGENDALRKRFLEEAPRRWEELRELSSQIQGEVNISSYRQDGDKQTLSYKWRYQIAQNGQSKLAVIRATFTKHPKQTALPRAIVANSKYAFTLSERKPNGGWILDELELFTPKKKQAIDVRFRDSIIYETSCANLMVKQIPLPKIVASKNFHLKKIEERQEGTAPFVSVSFEYDKDDTILGPFSGIITLDPANFWVVKTADLRCDIGTFNDRTEHLENTYVVSPRGFPIPQMMTVRTNIKQFVDEEKSEYSLREQADVPEHEFSLSAFGLLEPMGHEIPRPSETRYYVWFCLGGISLIAFGIFAIRWAKRMKATPPSELK
jgi:hypothetical protein